MGEQEYTIATTEELERLYSDAPYGPAVFKETDYVTPEYRKLIEAAPFCVLATCGPEGFDCSPRGDPPGFVRVVDEHTLVTIRTLAALKRCASLFRILGSYPRAVL